ncbi:MAG: hypothetical protein AAF203_06925 [Pseudomonadota bacterium]
MKKNFMSLILFLSVSFVCCGLQACLYFLPLPLPFFWFAILSYYSFKKSLLFALLINVIHVLVITTFTTVSGGLLLLIMNVFTLAFYLLRERFHTSHIHISVGSGIGCLLFLFSYWLGEGLLAGFSYPRILHWLLASVVTLIVTPPLVLFLESIDSWIHYERIDTLQNLRV